jgi:hypothetical protein
MSPVWCLEFVDACISDINIKRPRQLDMKKCLGHKSNQLNQHSNKLTKVLWASATDEYLNPLILELLDPEGYHDLPKRQK